MKKIENKSSKRILIDLNIKKYMYVFGEKNVNLKKMI